MRTVVSFVVSAVVVSSASAGVVGSAVIDDFGPSGAGLGFTRSESGGAYASGWGTLTNGGGFGYVSSLGSGYDASAYSGVSLQVSDLSGGTLELYVVGSSFGFVAMQVALNGFVSNGHVWITFDQIDAAVGNDAGWMQSAMASGEGIGGIGLAYSGTGSVTVDNFEFRSSPVAVPAPGALALLSVAGLVGARRRR